MHNDNVADEGVEDACHEDVFHEGPVHHHVRDETIPDVHGSSPHFNNELRWIETRLE